MHKDPKPLIFDRGPLRLVVIGLLIGLGASVVLWLPLKLLLGWE